ncbi:hypothetical protein RB195_015175 [Necator americanus]|uniref:Uncharacterized protein n=1 Tax=Necator americanus TaxID=51031 RepID=A0ABR1E3D3_NECAM
MVKRLGQWHPHSLSDGNRQRHLDICAQLLSKSRRFGWLDTIVIGDEKWVLYVNHTHKRAWYAGAEIPDPFVKGEIHEKVMLSIWWGDHGIYRFELLPVNTTITAESTALNCKDWPTRSARSTRSSTAFWSSDGKFTHSTGRTWPERLPPRPSRRISKPKESVIL